MDHLLLPSVYEHAQMSLLLSLAATSQRGSELSRSEAKQRSSHIPFEKHRSNCLFDRYQSANGKSRSDLHYSDSLMVVAEGQDVLLQVHLEYIIGQVHQGLFK
eukprot:gnl/MRDRNA2_/MRDRNA2_212763_c0_seq1.p1 gnl/MRDRNA2_/MRDRNA2_212763_c0~~gnl/MRDRNA2_/MRDRNA2_212763_c0_seq1.p1  ORF type:complete len:103 (+),score=14.29 gnl/MRDRNA2_/MRDRNA2_212763_c0_seq1:91-399(+)